MTLTSLRRLPDTSQTMDLTAHRVHRDDFAELPRIAGV